MLGSRTNRRTFIAALGSAAAWPLVASAQQPGRMRRIGMFINNTENAPETQEQIAAFRQALAQLGWLEGRNIHIELRFSANNYARVPQLAHERVVLNPDVIFASTTLAVKHRRRPARSPSSSWLYLIRSAPGSSQV
jgi:putative ABC transport system substrate-binding protein